MPSTESSNLGPLAAVHAAVKKLESVGPDEWAAVSKASADSEINKSTESTTSAQAKVKEEPQGESGSNDKDNVEKQTGNEKTEAADAQGATEPKANDITVKANDDTANGNVHAVKADGDAVNGNDSGDSDAVKVNGDTATVNSNTAKVNDGTVKVNGDTTEVNGDATKINGDTANGNADTAKVDCDTTNGDGDTTDRNGDTKAKQAKESPKIVPFHDKADSFIPILPDSGIRSRFLLAVCSALVAAAAPALSKVVLPMDLSEVQGNRSPEDFAFSRAELYGLEVVLRIIHVSHPPTMD